MNLLAAPSLENRHRPKAEIFTMGIGSKGSKTLLRTCGVIGYVVCGLISAHTVQSMEPRNVTHPGVTSFASPRQTLSPPNLHRADSHGSTRDAMWGTSSIPDSSTPGTPVHYEVLSRPASKREPSKPRTWAPEVIRPVKPYAYGWFGPPDTRSWYRQFGHQHSYVNYSRH